MTWILSELVHANANGRVLRVQEHLIVRESRKDEKLRLLTSLEAASLVATRRVAASDREGRGRRLCRMIVALASAGAVAIVAYRIRLLSPSGAIAATLVGAASVLAGADWVALLLFFFVSSTALSTWRRAEREQLVGGLIEKGGRRDAIQVLANGGIFAVAAFASTSGSTEFWHAVGAGAIAAATADTWSTEVGTVLGGTPRLILSGRRVPAGTSGGITAAGIVTSLAASVLAAFVALSVRWETPIHAIVAGGVIGSLVDSITGATIQERRWCEACGVYTERRRHTCGTPTVHRGGIRGLDNDIVNLTSTLAGAAVTWALT